MDGADRPDYERMISKLRAELGEEPFVHAWQRDRQWHWKVVIDYAY